MLRSKLRLVGAGEDSLLCVFWPPQNSIPDDMPGKCMAIPILLRENGILLAVPSGYLREEILKASADEEDDQSFFGPYKEFTSSLVEEDEQGEEYKLGLESPFMVLDLSSAALETLAEYDPVIDPSELIQPFSTDRPAAIVDVSESLPAILQWLETMGGRTNFLSAREEQDVPAKKAGTGAATKKANPKKITTAILAQQVEALTSQMQLIVAQQQELLNAQSQQTGRADAYAEPKIGVPVTSRLPPVSGGVPTAVQPLIPKTAQLVGPPPKVKQVTDAFPRPLGLPDTGEPLEEMAHVDQSPMAAALMQQSAALTSLVAHLTTGDPLSDLNASSSSGSSLSTKGVARRERLQQELASGSSNFFLQVQQQLFKKLYPARTLPRSEAELVGSGISMTTYLERFGGYKGKPDAAMTMWMLAHCMDCAAQQDHHRLREYLALTTACVEQAAMDGGWSLAWVMSLLEEPPVQVMAERSSGVSSLGRHFSPLIPPTWTAITLAYLKEVDLISSRKTEAKQPKGVPPKPADPSNPPPSPKRPRFPKKPKAEPPAKAAQN